MKNLDTPLDKEAHKALEDLLNKAGTLLHTSVDNTQETTTADAQGSDRMSTYMQANCQE